MVQGSKEWFEMMFPVIKATTLSPNDKFFQHKPISDRQSNFKAILEKGFQLGLHDFRHPIIDPSFTVDRKIVYEFGLKPAVGKSPVWWEVNFEKFMPEKKSRIGDEIEYVCFYATIIKTLIEEKKCTVSEAWRNVCDDSRKMGHYWNSDNSQHSFELTGSREVAGFYDHGNACKILQRSYGIDFWRAGGNYIYHSEDFPIADMSMIRYRHDSMQHATGWMVMNV